MNIVETDGERLLIGGARRCWSEGDRFDGRIAERIAVTDSRQSRGRVPAWWRKAWTDPAYRAR